MALVPHVNQQHLDANGDPLSGGTLTFSESGSATAKAVFSDEALSSSLGSSITLDSLGLPASGGNVVNVFGSGSYRVVLKDSGGTQIWSLDELNAGSKADLSDVIWLGTVSGTDTLTAAPSPAIDAYAAGQKFQFAAANNNTGAVTLNVNSKGAKTVQNNGNALQADDIVAGKHYEATYDGTNMQLAHISLPVRRFEDIVLEDTDSGASAGPNLYLRRKGDSQAASDVLGRLTFRGQDDADADEDYGGVQTTVVDATAANPDGRVDILTDVAGTFGAAFHFAQGAWTPNATSGDQGADTINATTYYTDGNQLRRWIDVETQTASTSATLDFETIPTGTQVFMIRFTGFVPDTDDVNLFIRLKFGGAFKSGASDYDYKYYDDGASTYDGAASEIQIGDANAGEAVGSASGEFADGEIWVHDPLGTTLTKMVRMRMSFMGADGEPRDHHGVGRFIGTGSTGALQGVRFLFASGNIESGSATAFALID